MRVPAWIWKMSLMGKVAVGNLLVLLICGLALLALRAAFPIGGGEMPLWLEFCTQLIWIICSIATFPLLFVTEWLLGSGGLHVGLNDFLALILGVILNAYFWGAVAELSLTVHSPRP